jgi:uncharacterized protein (DUF488 family)
MRIFCYSSGVVVHTLGHSTLALADFLALLQAHHLTAIADVRRYPASRRHPHFAREPLAEALEASGVTYLWLPELGGRRTSKRDSRHVAWRSATFRAYADHMETPEFAAGLERLLALARERSTALMCAEAVPWRCHRQLLADALLAHGVEVRHATGAGGAGAATVHKLTPFARLEGAAVVYDAGQTSLGRAGWSGDDPP